MARVMSANEWLDIVSKEEDEKMYGYKYPDIEVKKIKKQKHIKNIYRVSSKRKTIGYGALDRISEMVGLSVSACERLHYNCKQNPKYWHRKGYRIDMYLTRQEQIQNR